MASTSTRSRTASGTPSALRRAAVARRHDRYYMSVAGAVRGSESDDTPNRDGANCWGSKVGAVIVQGSGPTGERIISTGYNGTPAGFKNCLDGGCVRCKHRRTDPKAAGIGLDRCICVHAEQNALLTAARFGISVAGATIYSTLSPCFNCLKEAIQAGVARFVYLKEYAANYEPELQMQYDDLAKRLRGRDQLNFEQLVGTPATIDPVGQFPDAASTEESALADVHLKPSQPPQPPANFHP
jgi:dCMP deaminase